MAPLWRAAEMALRIGRAIPANEPMSNTIAVSNLLWTKPNALPVAGSAQPRVPPRPDVAESLQHSGKQPGENADDVGEPRIGRPVYAAWKTSSARRSDDGVMTPTKRREAVPHGANRNIQPMICVTAACSRAPGGPSSGTSWSTRAWPPCTVKSPTCGSLPPRTS